MTATLRDVRYGLRMLAKSPALAVVAVLTLAFGIGASTAIFSVVDGVLLRALPFPAPQRLAMLWERQPDGGTSNTSYATFVDWRREARSFSSLAAVSLWEPTLVKDDGARVLNGFRVSASMFGLLGVRPQLGRDFLAAEDAPGKNLEVLLSDELWRSEFGGDPGIVGRSIALGSRSYLVVGVLPRQLPSIFSFDARKPADIYAPLGYDTALPYACRTCRHLRVLARLRDPASLAQARAELSHGSEDLFRQYPGEYPAAGASVVPLDEHISGGARPMLLALFGAVGFFLLIACVNVTMLLLGWAMRRQREVAVRAALGASRSRLVRQFLAESLVVSLAGGALGWWLADTMLELLKSFGLSTVPRVSHVVLDARVLAFTAVVSIVAGVASGLAPALRASSVDLNQALKDGAAGGSAERHRLRSLLVTVNVALALVLLSGAGLMAKSLIVLLRVDPGFEPAGALAFDVSLWGRKFDTGEREGARNATRYFQEAIQRVESLPEVEAAGATSQLPLGGNLDQYGIHPADDPNPNPELDPSADRYSVTPGYLQAMKIPLAAGRDLDARDGADAPLVALVNRTLAQRLWPGQDAIGRQLRVGDAKSPLRTVVGVVGDVLHNSLSSPHTPQVYLPAPQWTDSAMTLVVRTRGDARAVLPAARMQIASVDAQQPISAGATLADVVAGSLEQRRLSALVVLLLAALALAVASAGIYGVISYGVAERMHEMGIRMALGARRRDVVKLVVAQGMKPVLLGVAVGLGAGLALARGLSALLYEVAPGDPSTFAAGCGLITAVALVACWLPARRATRADPLSALRSE